MSRAPDIDMEFDEDEELSEEEVTEAPAAREARANKYGLAAVQAAELCHVARMTPSEAWEEATRKLFGSGTPAQLKGCPKGAFLGLCQAGYVAGVPHGEYSRSKKNRDYAVAAARLIASEPRLAADWAQLWRRVLGGATKQHNSQMHVVIALWERGMLSVPEGVRAEPDGMV